VERVGDFHVNLSTTISKKVFNRELSVIDSGIFKIMNLRYPCFTYIPKTGMEHPKTYRHYSFN